VNAQNPTPPSPAAGPYESSIVSSRSARKAIEAKRAAARRRKVGGVMLAILAILGVTVLGAKWWTGRDGSAMAGGPAPSATGASCAKRTAVTLWASPAMAAPAQLLADAFVAKPDTGCYDYTITAKQPMETVIGLGKTQPNRPDGWIADSPRWVDQVNAVTGIHAVLTKPFARSPLVIAMDPKRAAALGDSPRWLDLVASDSAIRLSDPTSTTAGMLSLSAALPQLSGAQGRVVIQKLAKTTMKSPQELFATWSEKPDEASAFPVSEADLFQFNAANPQKKLTSVTPTEGTPAFEHSLINVATDPVRSQAIRDLNKFLATPEAAKVLVAHGLRPANTSATMPTPPGSVGPVTVGGSPPIEQVKAAMGVWQAATARFRLLTVFDVSGSMKAKVGRTTRVGITQEAAGIALAALPPTTELGVWMFSIDKGGPGIDYKEIAPIASLGDAAHKARIAKAAAGLSSAVEGGTGLYDTIWAAYQRVQKGYDPGRVNAVVILTDGKNEDPAGLTLEQLLANIKASDPKKPVAVTTIGVGPDVDPKALRAISRLANSDFYNAPAPGDITTVLAKALFDHKCVDGVCA
jgi:ABC-type molybdate transport system substrate-binding protein